MDVLVDHTASISADCSGHCGFSSAQPAPCHVCSIARGNPRVSHDGHQCSDRTMVRQLIDISHVNQRHLAGLREEIVSLRSQLSSLLPRAPPVPPVPQPSLPIVVPRSDSADVQPPPTEPGRVCRRPGCDSHAPVECCVQFCQTHCVSPRCRVHGQWTRNQERRCRFRGCSSMVPRECASGFCESHCTSLRCSLHHNRVTCTSSGCQSLPSPGCFAGCCTRHCTHRQCSPAATSRARRVPENHTLRRDPVRLSNICRNPVCSERVHPECSSHRCTLHCSSPHCPLHASPNGVGAATR